MNVGYGLRGFFVRAFAVTAVLTACAIAEARPWLRPVIYPVGKINTRGIVYNDHSRNTTLSSQRVAGGGFFTISTRSLFYSGVPGSNRYDVRVVLQDANHPPNSSGGVTVYRLTNVQRNGTVLRVQAPNIPVLRNRTYHVTVFLIGPQPMHYAYAGTLTVL